MHFDAAGWQEKFQCDSEVVTNLANMDPDYLTDDHLFAAQTAVSQSLGDSW